jgi:hypothetical protein
MARDSKKEVFNLLLQIEKYSEKMSASSVGNPTQMQIDLL